MEQNNELELLVAEVTGKMSERGNSPNTIARHMRVYSQLIVFAERCGERNYSDELITLFLEDRRTIAVNHSQRFMEQYSIALNKLADEAAGQEIQLNHRRFPVGPELTRFLWVLPEIENRLKIRLKNQQDIRGRIQELRNFLAYLEAEGICMLADINVNHLAEAFRHAGDKPRFHSVMCEFLELSFKQGWIPMDLSCFVPQVRAHKPVPVVYSTEEVEQVLGCIDDSTVSGKRKRAVFLIVARLGLRNSDVCELQFSNIDWGKKVISLVQKKTGIPIVLPMLPEIEEAIRAYIAVRPESDLPYIFLRHRAPFLPLRNTTVVYELRNLFAQAGINTQGKRCGPHALRSSLASSLLKEGVSYPVIQKALGHSSPTATKYYAKVDIERLRDCALEVPVASGKFAKLIGGDVNA